MLNKVNRGACFVVAVVGGTLSVARSVPLSLAGGATDRAEVVAVSVVSLVGGAWRLTGTRTERQLGSLSKPVFEGLNSAAIVL